MVEQSNNANKGAVINGEPLVNPWIDPKVGGTYFDNKEISNLRNKVIEYARAGVPVNLSGPAGLGKTSLAFQVAHALERPMSVMTGNAWLSSSDFVGGAIGTSSSTVVDRYVQSVRRTEKQSRTDWSSSVLALAMQNGHTLIYDEFTRASPEANATLLSVLEEGLLVCTDPAGPQRNIRAHANFRVILTSNPHDYVAVNTAPDALLDRVVTVPMIEYGSDTIASIVERRTGLDHALSRRLVAFMAAVRDQCADKKFSALRSAILVGRIAAFRAQVASLDDSGLFEIAADILRGRGIPVNSHMVDDALKQSKAA